MEIKDAGYQANTGARYFTVLVRPEDEAMYGNGIIARLIEMVATEIAAVYLEEHGNEVLAALDATAIANLALAKAAAEVGRTVQSGIASAERNTDRMVHAIDRTSVALRKRRWWNK